MKNLLFLLLIISAGCDKPNTQVNIDKEGYERMTAIKKDVIYENNPAGRGKPNSNFFHTCADSWGDEVVGSKGIAAQVDVLKLRLGNAKIKSWWIAFYHHYTDLEGNRIALWAQWGYAVDKFGLFPAFFVYKFVNGTGFQFPPNINYNPVSPPLEYNTLVRFEIRNKPGTTFWECSRNGQVAFEADLGFESATGIFQACTESWGNNTFNPSLTTYYLEVFQNGEWVKIPHGIANKYSWGVQGQVQRPEFDLSQTIMGSGIDFPQPVWLWGTP